MDFRKPKTPLLLLLAIIGLAILTIIILRPDDGEVFGRYGVNKTIGWAWDISQLCMDVYFFIISCVAAFLAGYVILLLLRGRTNKIITILHLALILCTIGLATTTTYLENICIYTIILSVISMGLMIANSIFAIRYKIADSRIKAG